MHKYMYAYYIANLFYRATLLSTELSLFKTVRRRHRCCCYWNRSFTICDTGTDRIFVVLRFMSVCCWLHAHSKNLPLSKGKHDSSKKNCLKKCVRAHYLSLNINISILSLVGCCYCCCWCGFFSSVIWFTKLSKYKKTLSHTHKKTMRCFFLLQHQHSVNITR